ncbi:MAG: hypothetical protein HY875_05190 [Chloroflexi bacterium]|nr:hypothetical protein [Chloroflexota bacterium]
MNQFALQELRRLRNEIAHGRQHPDAESLKGRLQGLGVAVPPGDPQQVVVDLFRSLELGGEDSLPPALIDVVRQLLEGRSAKVACDPWAGLGALAELVKDVTHAQQSIACAQSPTGDALGRLLAPELDWRSGDFADPLSFLQSFDDPIDIVASVLPYDVRAPQALEVPGDAGSTVRSRDLASILLAATCQRLAPQGIGLFVVAPRFFSTQSILRDLPRLGVGVEAALALPAGIFGPSAHISAYLIVIRKRESGRMFVAQLSQDRHTNSQIVNNLRTGDAQGALELGHLVDPDDFRERVDPTSNPLGVAIARYLTITRLNRGGFFVVG